MVIVKVAFLTDKDLDEILMSDIVVYDGRKSLHEFLEELGSRLNKRQKLQIKFCKNIAYSKPITVLINKEEREIEIKDIKDFYELLITLNEYKKDFNEITKEDRVIIESNDIGELVETIQQCINSHLNISIYSRSELERRSKVEKFLDNVNDFISRFDRFSNEFENLSNNTAEGANQLVEDIIKTIKENIPKIREALEKIQDNELKTCVVATKKAGKSMVVNCFLKEEYAPTSAELATPCIIKYIPSRSSKGQIKLVEKEYDYTGAEPKLVKETTVGVFKSPEEVKQKLKQIFDEANLKGKRTPDYEIHYYKPGAELSYVIYDTPGPDLAGSKHRVGLDHIIKESDVVIFIVDYSKYAIESEYSLFKDVVDAFKGKESVLIVAINKVDTMYDDKDSEKIAARVAEFMRDKYRELGIKNIIAIPVSAMWYFYLTKAADMYPEIKEDITKVNSIMDDSISTYLGAIERISSILRREYKKENQTYGDALALSNFETLIRYTNYIAQEKAYMVRVSKLISDIDIAINTIQNTLNANKVELGERVEELRKLMEDFKAKIDEIFEKYGVFKSLEEGEEELIKTSKQLRDNLMNLIQKKTDEDINKYINTWIDILTFARENFEGKSSTDFEDYIRKQIKAFENKKGISLEKFEIDTIIRDYDNFFTGLKTTLIENLNAQIIDISREYQEKVDKAQEELGKLVDETNAKLINLLGDAKDLENWPVNKPNFKPETDFTELEQEEIEKDLYETLKDIGLDLEKERIALTKFYKETFLSKSLKNLGKIFFGRRGEELIDSELVAPLFKEFNKEDAIHYLEEQLKEEEDRIRRKIKELESMVDSKVEKIENGVIWKIRYSIAKTREQHEEYVDSIKSFANKMLYRINVSKEEQEKALKYVEMVEERGFNDLKEFWDRVYKEGRVTTQEKALKYMEKEGRDTIVVEHFFKAYERKPELLLELYEEVYGHSKTSLTKEDIKRLHNDAEERLKELLGNDNINSAIDEFLDNLGELNTTAGRFLIDTKLQILSYPENNEILRKYYKGSKDNDKLAKIVKYIGKITEVSMDEEVRASGISEIRLKEPEKAEMKEEINDYKKQREKTIDRRSCPLCAVRKFIGLMRKFIGLMLLLIGVFSISSQYYMNENAILIALEEDPVEYMQELAQKEDWERLSIYADFYRSLPFSDETRQVAEEMYKKAEEEKNSLANKIKGCAKGAITGQVEDLSSLSCDFLVNLTPIGDLRDLAIHGFLSTSCYTMGIGCEEKDLLILALSGMGLALTFAPEFKPALSVIKALEEAKALNKSMLDYIIKLGDNAFKNAFKNTDEIKTFVKANWSFFNAYRKYGFKPVQDVYRFMEDGKSVEKMVMLTDKYGVPKSYMAVMRTEGSVLKENKGIVFFSPKFSMLNVLKASVKTLWQGGYELFMGFLAKMIGYIGGIVLVALGLILLLGRRIFSLFRWPILR